MRRHSLLIGVQDYEGSAGLTPLACALADVALVESVVSDPRYMGPEPRVLAVKNPTNAEAMSAIQSFLADVAPDDVVVFYFSGHGMRDVMGDLFLCFCDTIETDLELTALRTARLARIFESKFLRRVLVVLDCCYSGAAGAQMTRDSVLSKLNDMEHAQPDGKGLYVLSSSGAAETTKEGAECGVFTGHLVNGIVSGEADTDQDGRITVQDVARYLQRKVPEDAPGQTPHLSSHAVTGSFVVALNEAVQVQKQKAEDDARRVCAFSAARDRLLTSYRAGDVTRVLMNSVLDWIEQFPEADVAAEPFVSLEAYGETRIGLAEFVPQWAGWQAAEAEARIKPDPEGVKPQVPASDASADPRPAKSDPGRATGIAPLLFRMLLLRWRAGKRDHGTSVMAPKPDQPRDTTRPKGGLVRLLVQVVLIVALSFGLVVSLGLIIFPALNYSIQDWTIVFASVPTFVAVGIATGFSPMVSRASITSATLCLAALWAVLLTGGIFGEVGFMTALVAVATPFLLGLTFWIVRGPLKNARWS